MWCFKDVKVNQFDSSRAADCFVEPVIPGYERVNLADMAASSRKDNRTTVRRTLPRPGRGTASSSAAAPTSR